MITENIAHRPYSEMRDGANKEKAKRSDTAWTRSLQNAMNEKWFAHPLIIYSNSFIIGSQFKAEVNTTSTEEATSQHYLSEKRSSALLTSDRKYEQSADRGIPAPDNSKYQYSYTHSSLKEFVRENSVPFLTQNAHLPIWNKKGAEHISDDMSNYPMRNASHQANIDTSEPITPLGQPLSNLDFNSARKSFIIGGNGESLRPSQWHMELSSDVEMNFVPFELNGVMPTQKFLNLVNVQRSENSIVTGIQRTLVLQSAESEINAGEKVYLQRDLNFSRPKNPPIRMHIENHEDGAKVWIGCDRISDSQRNNLIERVQSMLLYYGHPVESMVINGTPVALQEARLKTKSRVNNHSNTESNTQNSNFLQAAEVIRRYSENSEAK